MLVLIVISHAFLVLRKRKKHPRTFSKMHTALVLVLQNHPSRQSQMCVILDIIFLCVGFHTAHMKTHKYIQPPPHSLPLHCADDDRQEKAGRPDSALFQD